MEGCNKTSLSSSYQVLATLITLLILFTSGLTTCSAARKANTEFIRTACGSTTYPRVCFKSLSAYASTIQTSPRQMAHAALSVSLEGAWSTSALMSRLSIGHGMKPKEVGAMRDCIENMSDSVDELRQSIREMSQLGGPDFGLHVNNIETWVSAALTEEDTCMDGFAGKAMNGNVKMVVRGRIVRVAQMTSNALALINGLAATQANLP